MNYSFINDDTNENFISMNKRFNSNDPLSRELDVFNMHCPRQDEGQNSYSLSEIQFAKYKPDAYLAREREPWGHSSQSYQHGHEYGHAYGHEKGVVNPYGNQALYRENKPAPIVQPTLAWNNVASKYKGKNHEYYFQTPYKKYFELVKLYGPPTAINANPGGIAVWDETKKSLLQIYTRLEILDQESYNKYPYEHIGFIYVYYRISIPIYKLANVLSLSNDIKYDIINKSLIVRGMSLAYCNALIAVTIKYVKGDYSWHSIINNEILKKELSIKSLKNENNKRINIEILKETKIWN